MKHFDYDVVVIGGGHAGCEAAHVCARMGVRTALVTMKASDIGVMSCNPAIGGLGKGHLVREIDALDGVMGRVADTAGIQFRLLNRRKGPAVQGPRAQADRLLYRKGMCAITETQSNLDVVEAEVVDLYVEKEVVSGVELADGSTIRSRAVVLTSGTFLRGVIHIGDVSHSGGRMGDQASSRLAETIDGFGLSTGRLKTGTPPRLDGDTIDWAKLEKQPGDEQPSMFSFLSSHPSAKQVSCGITHTNSRTHDIIRNNLERSAMYGGHIDGVGPRYCPSIEDKVVRFADKESHQVFLEPESLSNSTVYPNGISTSLPVEVQEEYVRSIFGLENVVIQQPGYAIEYDYVDPRNLNSQLQLGGVEGLYLAGQINGTTGYEEAAAQGLVAGMAACRSIRGKEPVTFSRSNSYIGVMVDDLTTRGVTEPYRMFTSRAEFRLSLRADNADQRLTMTGVDVGCVGRDRRIVFEEKTKRLNKGREILQRATFTPSELSGAGIRVSQDGQRRNLMQILSFPDVMMENLVKLEPELEALKLDIATQLEKEALYSNYLERQRKDIEALQKDENEVIPGGFDYYGVTGLSNELKSKFSSTRPENLAQAGRVDGATPAALALILANLKKVVRRA